MYLLKSYLYDQPGPQTNSLMSRRIRRRGEPLLLTMGVRKNCLSTSVYRTRLSHGPSQARDFLLSSPLSSLSWILSGNRVPRIVHYLLMSTFSTDLPRSKAVSPFVRRRPREPLPTTPCPDEVSGRDGRKVGCRRKWVVCREFAEGTRCDTVYTPSLSSIFLFQGPGDPSLKDHTPLPFAPSRLSLIHSPRYILESLPTVSTYTHDNTLSHQSLLERLFYCKLVSGSISPHLVCG